MRRTGVPILIAALVSATSAPLFAKDSLGVFGGWGAFRDPAAPRCYAIARPSARGASGDVQPFATIGTWPKRNIRGQVHFRLARPARLDAAIRLTIGSTRFDLIGGNSDAWAADRRMDAAIVAAMRSAGRMTVRYTDQRGRGASESYALEGAASAMDAATLGCARR